MPNADKYVLYCDDIWKGMGPSMGQFFPRLSDAARLSLWTSLEWSIFEMFI